MRKGQPDPPREILENFMFLAATSLQRQRAEEALQSSTERLDEAQKITRIGNWEANMITGQLHWSDVIFDIFGFDSKSFQPSVNAFLDAA
jgi:GAF domain-containing protein